VKDQGFGGSWLPDILKEWVAAPNTSSASVIDPAKVLSPARHGKRRFGLNGVAPLQGGRHTCHSSFFLAGQACPGLR